jgi:hypothetical protein
MLNSEEIITEVESRERFLEQLVRGELIEPVLGENQQLKFLVARRWNSWYPSYFSTLGGCYVIQTRDNEHCGDKKDKNSGCIVVDPGFGFLNELRKKYKIEPHEIRSIIVSHFHPDHMAGVIEFLTLTHESKHPCNIYLNKTSFEYFKSFQGKYNRIYQLNGGQSVELAKYKFEQKNSKLDESIYVRALKVHHAEIGNTHQSLGLIFTIKTGKVDWKLGILGDTDGSDLYMNEYVERFRGVNVLVLHLGTYSDTNYGQGDKHLYRTGIIKLLNALSEDATFKANLKLLILSEFGLEMAEIEELRNLCKDFVNSHNFFNMIAFYKFLSGDQHKFHRSMFSKFSNDVITDFLKNDNENYDNIYASLFGILIVIDPMGFKNRGAIKIDAQKILSSKQGLRDFNEWCIEINSDYANAINEFLKKYIKEMIKFWGSDVDTSLNILKDLTTKIFNHLSENQFYQSRNPGAINNFEIMHYIEKYLKSIKIIDNDSLIEIFAKIEKLQIDEIMLRILFITASMYKISKEIQDDRKEIKQLNLDKGIEIMPSILNALKDECRDELINRLFLSHNGIELVFSNSISIKGLDKNDKESYIPVDRAFQDPKNSMKIIRKPIVLDNFCEIPPKDIDIWHLSIPAPNGFLDTDLQICQTETNL